jgi:organic radical activating enzyme
LSSTIASELKQFVSIDESAIADVTKYFVDNAASLKKIYMAGGEPMLIKENQAILEKLLEVNPNCHFIVNTNLSMIRNNRIFDLLTKFKNVEWLISVDDMGEKYNYIRYPGNWDQFVGNLDYLKVTIPDTHTVKFNMVYLAMNAKTMFDCVDFLLENKHAQKPEHINLAYVNNGHQFIWCDPRALPDTYLDEVRAVIDARKPTGSRLDDDIRYLRECLDVPVVKEAYHDLFMRLETLDKRRKIDSQKVFSDIYASRQ